MTERYTIHENKKQVGFDTDFDAAVEKAENLFHKNGRPTEVRDESFTLVWSSDDEMPEPTEGFPGPTPVLPLNNIAMWSDTLVKDQREDAVKAGDAARVAALDAELARRAEIAAGTAVYTR